MATLTTDDLEDRIANSEQELALFIDACEDLKTVEAGRVIASLNSKIENCKKLWHSACSRAFRKDEKFKAAYQHAQLAAGSDKSAKEWEQQRARMVDKWRVDVLADLSNELARQNAMASAIDGLEEID